MRVLFAALISTGACAVAACSPATQTTAPQAAATASAAPSASPNLNFAERARPSCATPGPAFAYVNPGTKRPYAASASAFVLSFANAIPNPYPAAVPALAVVRSLPAHDFGQLILLPDGPDADAYLAHVAFTDRLAQNVANARKQGVAPPSPDPVFAAAEARYVRDVAPRIRDESLAASFDDSYYDGDEGDPNHDDPHRFAAICRFLGWQTPAGKRQTYTLVVRLLHRIQDTSSEAAQSTQALLKHNAAAPEDFGGVGWSVAGEWTLSAQHVAPALLPATLADDDAQLPSIAHLNWTIAVAGNPEYLPMQQPAPASSPSPAVPE